MFKDLLRIPDTFDPDDRRRRQVLNILLIGMGLLSILAGIATWAILAYHLDTHEGFSEEHLIVPNLFAFLVCLGLLVANRSTKIPGWVSGSIFVGLLIVLFVQTDTSQELYNGRSLIVWVLPIMIGAVVLRPGSVFVIVAAVFALMWVSPPPNGVNYYAMLALFFIALISWLGMSIANRAILDARRHAANLEAIFNSVAEGVLVLDLQGNLLSANPALLEMIPEEELRRIITRPLGKTFDWRRRVFSVTVSPVPEVGTVAVIRDDTRRHETERARDALIATASHELRTPLAAVMNYLELLALLSRQGKFNGRDYVQHLTRALENCKRLQLLVDNILDQAQIQAGVLELKEQPFDLRGLLERTRQLLESLITKKNLSYESTVGPDVPAEIVSDPQRLQQVLVNLIGNAIKFTDHGGIRVNVSAPRENEIHIEVKDSGAGIPPEQLPDIFEAFRRGSDYAQRERQGAGLGLSIVKEIVTRMGGEISVSSDPGRGSSFVVTLPVTAA